MVDCNIVIDTFLSEGHHVVNKPPERPSKSNIEKDQSFKHGSKVVCALSLAIIVSWIRRTLSLWDLMSPLRAINLEAPPTPRALIGRTIMGIPFEGIFPLEGP